MSSEKANEAPHSDPFAGTEIQFKGERPWIRKDANAPEFRVNQPIYVDLGEGREGPYVVARVNTNSTPPTYLLETEDGQAVNGGHEVEEARLSGEP